MSYKVKKYNILIYCYTLVLALISYFILSRLIDLGDTQRFVNSGPRFANPLSSTELTEMIFGSLGAFVPEVVVVIITCLFVNMMLTMNLFDNNSLSKEYVYLLILPNTIIWIILPTKEMLLFVSVIMFLTGVKQRRYLYMMAAMSILIIFKPHIFLPVFVIIFFRFICLRFKQKFVVVFVIIFISIYFAILLIDAYHENFSVLSLSLSQHFRSDGTLTRQNLFLNEYDYIMNVPKGIYLSLFTVLPSEVFGSLKFTILFLEGALTVLLLIYIIHTKLKELFDIFCTYSVLILSSVMQYPLSIFNAGSASRYRVAIILAVIVMIEVIKITNLRRSHVDRSLQAKVAIGSNA